jgi:hypothetical protein
MNRLLVVSPNFPPINSADMHRVRMSLPHFEASGWKPFVLAISPEFQDGVIEPALLQSLPAGLAVKYVEALPLRTSRRVGIGNVALRGFAHLYRAGAELIRREAIDLVFFSTTMFPAMALGRLWKQRCDVPYVLDMQDPWLTDYQGTSAAQPTAKQVLARQLHGALEPFTMRKVDGLIAVSDAYTATLRHRYPWITNDMCATVPFGVNEADFDLARELQWQNSFFDSADGNLHGVSVGRGGDDMQLAATILLRALRDTAAAEAQRVRLSFVGTDYATDHRRRRTIAPLADQEGLSSLVTESPARVPYFEGLRLLLDAQFLILLGSDDTQYSPSKVYPYLAAQRPIVAILHERSPVVDLIRTSDAGIVVTYSGRDDIARSVRQLALALATFLPRLPFEPAGCMRALAAYTAPELTRRQCQMFDAVMRRRLAVAEVACPESR